MILWIDGSKNWIYAGYIALHQLRIKHVLSTENMLHKKNYKQLFTHDTQNLRRICACMNSIYATKCILIPFTHTTWFTHGMLDTRTIQSTIIYAWYPEFTHNLRVYEFHLRCKTHYFHLRIQLGLRTVRFVRINNHLRMIPGITEYLRNEKSIYAWCAGTEFIYAWYSGADLIYTSYADIILFTHDKQNLLRIYT